MCLVTSCWAGSRVIRCSFIKGMKTANVKKRKYIKTGQYLYAVLMIRYGLEYMYLDRNDPLNNHNVCIC